MIGNTRVIHGVCHAVSSAKSSACRHPSRTVLARLISAALYHSRLQRAVCTRALTDCFGHAAVQHNELNGALDPECDSEAEIVRSIFRRYAELGSVRLLKDELEARRIDARSLTSALGRLVGGKPFSRGALYLILQNRISRGSGSPEIKLHRRGR
jgi:hypothetical protein